jgi:selenocysteine-specific elongation factor
MRVVATAGHVDHGKSTLVWALTGIDPDRWAIEKQRGMTIDLGFAATTLPSGAEIGFVDVPGHGRFVKNMLAGVGSVDACLFVVAATEGWKAQSEEHFRILELLGVEHGVVALTKAALAGPDLAELASLEIQERVAGTFLERAELLSVDVPAGIGLDELRLALDRLVADTPAAPDRDRPRMWVDRSFTLKGSGTVITGTLTGGSITTGTEMLIEPGGGRVRIRGLESHNQSLSRAAPGRRLAANLSGLPHRGVGRGQALVRLGQWHLSTRFDASLRVLQSLDHPVTRRGAYAVYIGSGEFPVRLRVLGPRPLEPGEAGLIRLWLRGPDRIPLSPGDRYVLREAGRFETVGGGEVLDVEPILPAARAAPSRSVERVVRERGWVDAAELFRLTGQRLNTTVGKWVVDPGAVEATRQAVVERCEKAADKGVDLAHFGEQQRALLAQGMDGVELRAGRVYRVGMARDELSGNAVRVLALLDAGGWSPPALPLSDRAALRELERAGLAVEAGEAWFAAAAVRSAVDALGGLLAEQPQGFTVAEARDRLGSSRKHVLPLLSHLDSIGITARRGDLRVAGRKLTSARVDTAR